MIKAPIQDFTRWAGGWSGQSPSDLLNRLVTGPRWQQFVFQPRVPLGQQHHRRLPPLLIFALVVLVLTGVLGQRFYNQPGLQVGAVANQTIYAPAAASVIDHQTTEERRRDARNGVLPVLQLDTNVNDAVLRSLRALTAEISTVKHRLGDLPFVSTEVLSTPIQAYLRRCEEPVWLKLQGLLTPLTQTMGHADGRSLNTLLTNQVLLPQQTKALSELLRYHQRTSTPQLRSLVATIGQSRQAYQRAQADLARLEAHYQVLGPLFNAILELNDQDWLGAQVGIYRVANRMLTQGIPLGLPPELLRNAITLQLQGEVPATAQEVATGMLTTVLKPNLVEDSERTRLQAEKAAQSVQSVLVEVGPGELIVTTGDTINQRQFVLLDHFNLSQRRFNYWGLLLFGGLISGGLALFLWVERHSSHQLHRPDYLLLGAMAVSVGVLNMFDAAAYALPAIGLLVGSFYGPLLGGLLVLELALLLPIGASVQGLSFTASALGAMVCSLTAERLRSREELALLGGAAGLTQGVVYLILTSMINPVSLVSAWPTILAGAVQQGIYGVLSSIVALGLSPYLEHAFDLITPIRLAELSNPNRPMLKRLASEAPGTFQHTLFVASLAEAAARALGRNVELVRAGTLYHDIGKMHDPMGFIENQMGGPNKHDLLQDPWKSADIIKQHVSQGLVMARKCRLPRAVQAFIPEHQGTMLISYFYHQAAQRARTEPDITLRESDFRYPGPIPQSPETGIVMLADSCEAALRSLTNATPEEALAMVNRILRARWKDHQLVASGLTREHMSLIAEIFVRVWQQYHHKRIAYPQQALQPLKS
jgi:hypothetical protein